MSQTRPIAILVTGEPVREAWEVGGRFHEMIETAAGRPWAGRFMTIEGVDSGALPAPRLFSGVVVTGSPASVTEELPWMQRTASWLREAQHEGLWVLGLCFGHQLLAWALGGTVTRRPAGPEVGTVRADVLGADTLFDGRPDDLLVNMMHYDSVAIPPPHADILARTAQEPHAALRFAERVWGVQFHPEFDAAIVRGYLSARRPDLEGWGLDVRRISAALADTPAATRVLRRFLAAVDG